MKWRTGAAIALAGAVVACTVSSGRNRAGGEASINVADAALSAGMFDLALNVTNTILARHPNDTAALATKGDALFASGNAVGAEVVYRALLALDPGSVRGMIGMGRVQLHADPQAAEAWFVRVLQREPRNVVALSDLGIARDLQGRHDDAQQAYRQALGIDPNNQRTMTNLGLSVALSGHPQQGAAILRPLAEQPGAPPQMRADLATALALGGDAAGAQKAMEGGGANPGGAPPEALAARSAPDNRERVAAARLPQPSAAAPLPQPSAAAIQPGPAAPVAPSPAPPVAPSPAVPAVIATPPSARPTVVATTTPPSAVPPAVAPVAPRVAARSSGGGGASSAAPRPAASAPLLAGDWPDAESGCPLASAKDANAPEALLVTSWLNGAGCGAPASSVGQAGATPPPLPAMLALAATSPASWPVAEPTPMLADSAVEAMATPAVAPTVASNAAGEAATTAPVAIQPEEGMPPAASLARIGDTRSDMPPQGALAGLLDQLVTTPSDDALLAEVVRRAVAVPSADVAVEPPESQWSLQAADSEPAAPQSTATAAPQGSPKAASAAGHPAPGDGWHPYVQVASLDSEQAARVTWEQLTQRAPALFDGYKPVVVQVEIDGRPFWRLRTTGFADMDAAKDFCAQIVAVGSGCWVTRGWP